MGNEENKQQGKQDPAGTTNTTDKWKPNQPQPGSDDPNNQDMSKKDPSRQQGERHDQEESDQGSKRRAS